MTDEHTARINRQTNAVRQMMNQIHDDHRAAVGELHKRIEYLDSRVEWYRQCVLELNETIGCKNVELAEARKELGRKNAEIARLQQERVSAEVDIAGKKQIITSLNAGIIERNSTITQLQDSLASAEQRCNDRDTRVDQLQKELDSACEEIDNYTSKLNLLRSHPHRSGSIVKIMRQIRAEVNRQFEVWGEQNHGYSEDTADAYADTAEIYKKLNALDVESGNTTWDRVLLEEVYEALAETKDLDARCTELIQVAALCVTEVEAITRRRAAKKPKTMRSAETLVANAMAAVKAERTRDRLLGPAVGQPRNPFAYYDAERASEAKTDGKPEMI